MEEYLNYMKTLRTQMNDVEDQAAKISVEEQMQITTIQTLDKDLNSAKSETRRLIDEKGRMMKTKGDICSQILEKQKKIASLECDSSVLSQTLELIQQEKTSLSTKVVEKRAYYAKIAGEMNAKFQEDQDWLNSRKFQKKVTQLSNVEENAIEEKSGNEFHHTTRSLACPDNKLLMRELDGAKAKLDATRQAKLKLVADNHKMKQTLQQFRCQINDLKPQLRDMDVMTLEEEQSALFSDKGGEKEYALTLQEQMKQLQGISHVIKCACGCEYQVKKDLCV